MNGITIDAYCILGVDREYDLTEAELLRSMDEAEVERAVIAPPDRWLAVLNREGNGLMLEAASRHPSRFVPACSVNPWYGARAVEEMNRAAGQGARVLVLHPFVQGYQANDELVWPVLDAAAPGQIPVYVHTGPPGNATPWQVVDLAERYPETDFIIGHCGATDFWNDMLHAGAAAPNVFFESSLARPFVSAQYVRAIGKDKGIMGSSAPLHELRFEWDQMRQVLAPDEFAGVYGGNLLRLLEKGP